MLDTSTTQTKRELDGTDVVDLIRRDLEHIERDKSIPGHQAINSSYEMFYKVICYAIIDAFPDGCRMKSEKQAQRVLSMVDGGAGALFQAMGRPNSKDLAPAQIGGSASYAAAPIIAAIGVMRS